MADGERNADPLANERDDDEQTATTVLPTGPLTIKHKVLAKAIRSTAGFVQSDKFDGQGFNSAKNRRLILIDNWQKYSEIFWKLMETASDGQQKEYEKSFEEIQEEYVLALSILEMRMDETAQINPRSVAGDDGSELDESGKRVFNVKLHSNEITNTWGDFDGNPMKWKSFHDRFLVDVHQNKHIPNARKFALLKKSLIGSAAKAFGEWELSDAGYDDAWQRLLQLYDRKYVICTEHIHKLFSLPILTKPATSDQLSHIANVAHEQLRQLRAHGIPVEHWDMIVCVMLHDRLQNDTGREWDLKRSSETPSAREMIGFLDKQAAALKNCKSVSRESLQVTIENDYSRRNANRYSAGPSTGAVPKKYPCESCSSYDHLIYDCSDFLALNLNGRWMFVRDLCPNCLRRGHSKDRCYSVRCSLAACAADPLHNSLLCPYKQGKQNVHALRDAGCDDWNRKDWDDMDGAHGYNLGKSKGKRSFP